MLAHMLEVLARLPEAEEEYRAALALNPRFLPAQVGLVRTYLAAGRMAEAREMLEAAKQTAPEHPAVRTLEEQLADNGT